MNKCMCKRILYIFLSFWILMTLGAEVCAQSNETPNSSFPAWPNTARNIVLKDEMPYMPTWKKVLLYPVNRGADLLDCFSLQLGFGFGAHLNVHATDAAQIGGGATVVSKFGLDKRQFGLMNQSKAEVAIFPFNPVSEKQTNALGTYKNYRSTEDLPWRYQLYQDYYGIGAELTALIVSLRAEVYPVEFIDFIVGIPALDLKHDDLPHRSDGKQDMVFSTPESRLITNVAIVPSRVINDNEARLDVPSGIGVYYHRYIKEKLFGLVGSTMGAGADKAEAKKLSALIKENNYDMEKYLLQGLKHNAETYLNWNVTDLEEVLEDYREHAIQESYKGQTIKRLPDYTALCDHYNVDAVLDVRIWEWGIMREKSSQKATMYLDVELKLIKYPERIVVFDTRITSRQEDKKGQEITDLARDHGMAVVRESEEAADIIHAKFTDIIIEKQ